MGGVKMKIASCWCLLFAVVAMDATNVSEIMDNWSKQTSMKLQIDGDIMFGGLFAIHESGVDGGRKCGRIEKDVGIQRLEAMLFAVNRINNDRLRLFPPGMKIGVHILDTCSRDTYALEQSMDFVRGRVSTLDYTERMQCSDGRVSIGRRSLRKPVVGVIGSGSSTESIMVANILRLFQIPQISYASTAQELSDKTRYDFFTRVVPPDSLQTSAMLDIVRMFGWSYVSTLADEGSYGEKGIAAFEKQARSSGICIARSSKIPREPTDASFDQAVAELKGEKRARVVVMFVSEMNVKNFLRSVHRNNQTGSFHFLASDSWGMKMVPVEGHEATAEGAISILPKRSELPEFTRYFTSLRPADASRNPWFDDFWEFAFKCRLDARTAASAQLPLCTGQERLNATTFKQEGLVQMVVDSVYALAHAVRNLMLENCSHLFSQPIYLNRSWLESCALLNPPNGSEILRHIRSVNFIGAANNNVRFDSKTGDGIGRYDIFQFQKQDDRYAYVKIGDWEPPETRSVALQINLPIIKWRDSDGRLKTVLYNRSSFPANSSAYERFEIVEPVRQSSHSQAQDSLELFGMEVPVSTCSDACPAGFRMQYQGTDKCCWICLECSPYDRLRDAFTCEECPIGSMPDETRTSCEPLPITYMNWSSVWALVPTGVSALGALLGIASFVIFIRYEKTPVIKASGRELCYVIIAGCLSSFIMTFVTLAKPTVYSCAVFRFGNGFSLSLIYSAIFTKTNRLSRIFNRGIKAMMKRPSYTSPKSQVVICMCLVAVQIIGDVMWLGIELPETTLIYPDRQTVVLKCKLEDVAIIISLTYNMVLIALCTVFAFKVRDVPENFNEAKYIAFAMYSNCILWLGFLAIYFGTRHDFRIQLTSICMTVSLTGWTILATIFAPKFYVVFCQPQKNNRRFSMHTSKHEASVTPQRSNTNNSTRTSECVVQSTEESDDREFNDLATPLGLTMLITSPRLSVRSQNFELKSPQEELDCTSETIEFPHRPRVHFNRKDNSCVPDSDLIASPGSSTQNAKAESLSANTAEQPLIAD